LHLSNSITLKQLHKNDAEGILQAVNKNRHHLRAWLPWVDHMHTVQDFQRYIDHSNQKTAEGSEMGYVIFCGNEVAGRIGIYNIDQQNKHCSLGYWLGTDYERKGIITNACKKLINVCFNELGMNRVEIRCGTGNKKSAAIPERLGFKKEGVIRQGEFVNDRFIDLTVYSLLKEEALDLNTS
jgi:ribosomal-protein-serine acetyltransferase